MGVQFGLELILVGGMFFFGLILLYYFFVGEKRTRKDQQDPVLLDYAKSFFPLIVLVLLLRSFVAEPFRIPSGSMIPTLEVGDFILVKKYSYGLRLPIIQKKIMDTGKPERGDVVVFRYPPNPQINYIKRLIGLPGDHIKWTVDKKLIINEKPVSYKLEGKHLTKEGFAFKLKEALPNNKPHDLILFDKSTKVGEWIVPEGHYFMMGDNRDKSSDSRSWGFVPEANLVGRASLVWMHWNSLEDGDGFQASRIGATVN